MGNVKYLFRKFIIELQNFQIMKSEIYVRFGLCVFFYLTKVKILGLMIASIQFKIHDSQELSE